MTNNTLPTHTKPLLKEIPASESTCRFCSNELKYSVVNLGMSPLCQKHVKPENANDMEKFYPLHAYVCDHCWLMQLEEFATPDEIFADDYAYFSSYSDSWVAHAKQYTELMIDRFGLNDNSLVVEIASNDGSFYNGLTKTTFRY